MPHGLLVNNRVAAVVAADEAGATRDPDAKIVQVLGQQRLLVAHRTVHQAETRQAFLRIKRQQVLGCQYPSLDLVLAEHVDVVLGLAAPPQIPNPLLRHLAVAVLTCQNPEVGMSIKFDERVDMLAFQGFLAQLPVATRRRDQQCLTQYRDLDTNPGSSSGSSSQ